MDNKCFCAFVNGTTFLHLLQCNLWHSWIRCLTPTKRHAGGMGYPCTNPWCGRWRTISKTREAKSTRCGMYAAIQSEVRAVLELWNVNRTLKEIISMLILLRTPEGANWGPKWASFICSLTCSIVYLWTFILCKVWSLPILGRVLNLLWRAGHFLPQFVHTNSPTAPIWNIFNCIEFLLERNIIATKMKENSWVVGVLWGFEPFSYGNRHIRVYMHHVSLIQSISERKATHMKLGTWPGSS